MLLMTGLIIAAVGPQYFGIMQMPSPPPEPANYSNIQAAWRNTLHRLCLSI